MELKYVCRDLPGGTRTRSNRTFMELKYHVVEVRRVVYRSNRTFMELKLVSRIYIAFKTICSNRTFMELKYRINAQGFEDTQF